MFDAIVEECAQPLFYFFLRKTRVMEDAEDLTSEVLLAYMMARSQQREIRQPHGWIWRVARNRYAAWLTSRSRQSVALNEAHQDHRDLEAELVNQEELALLRRELAFIREEHRTLIVAHYIRGESLTDIAARLRIPIGTVKARLSRCRKKIREGMEMARTFGPRSYNPENMDYSTSGSQPTDLPSRAMKRRLPVNILLEASENPSTIEELSMALGVAAPYMEEEVRLLLDATLMKRVGDQYVTDFYIMPSDTSERVYCLLRKEAPMHTEVVRVIALDTLSLLRRISPDTAQWSDSDLLWWLLPWVHEAALFREPRYISDPPERSCGKNETWGIVGYEQPVKTGKERCFLGRNLQQYAGGSAGIYNYDHPCPEMFWRIGSMNRDQTVLLLSLARGEATLSSLSAEDRVTWQSLEGRYAHAEGDRAVPHMILLTADGARSLRQAITAHPAFSGLQAAATRAFDHLSAYLKGQMSDTLLPQLNFVTSNEYLSLRMMVLNDCSAQGLLTLPEHPETSTIGLWLECV